MQLDVSDSTSEIGGDKSFVELIQLMQQKGIRVRTLLEELHMLIEHRDDLHHGSCQDNTTGDQPTDAGPCK
jgi:hypothetical protein